MKKLNEFFYISDDAEYTLSHDTRLVLESGYAFVQDGGHAEVLRRGGCNVQPGGLATLLRGGDAVVMKGGCAIVQEGGYADVQPGGIETTTDETPVNLASDEQFILRTCQGLFQAGCHRWFTRAQALAHWDREDDRACLFTLAILSCDWGN